MKSYFGGFWIRVCALFIDSMFLLCLTGLVNLTLGLKFFTLTPENSSNTFIATMASLFMSISYYTVFQAINSGTFGKKLLGLKLVDARTLGKVSVLQIFPRYLMQLVSAFCLGMGYLCVAINDRKQGWHDKVAGTLVVKSSLLPELMEDEGKFPEEERKAA